MREMSLLMTDIAIAMGDPLMISRGELLVVVEAVNPVAAAVGVEAGGATGLPSLPMTVAGVAVAGTEAFPLPKRLVLTRTGAVAACSVAAATALSETDARRVRKL